MKIKLRKNPSNRIGLIALICCSCAILHTTPNVPVVVLGQQTATTISQQQQQAAASTTTITATATTTNDNQQLVNNLNIQRQKPMVASKSTQRIGLAPHDRPACQLTTANHYQAQLPRQLSANNNDQQRQHGPATLNNQSQQANNSAPVVSSYGPTISSPNVISLVSSQQQQQQGGSLNNKTTQATAAEQQHSPATLQQRKATDTSERLRQLRQLLLSNNYDAYLVTPNDEHGSEYVSDYDRRLEFISGFSGSNGFALILLDRAVFFTDGRYALQADQELDCNWWLVVGDQQAADISQWLKSNAPKGLKVATDARLMSLELYEDLNEQLRSNLDSEFVLISQDLVDIVWSNFQQQQQNGDQSNQLRPRPMGPILVQPIEFAGQVSWQEKMVKLADQMFKLRARHYVVSRLDDIAWLLNLRGSDIPMSPLFKAYLLVSRTAQPASGGDALLNSLGSTVAGRPTSPRATPMSTAPPGGLSIIDKLFQQQQSNTLVQTSELIKVTLYIDLNKITPQVREHLRLDNGTVVISPTTSTLGEQQQQQQEQSTLTSRIQVELKDYDVFIMDFGDKFSFGTSMNPHHQSLAGRAVPEKLLLDSQANVAIHVLAKNYEDRLVLVEPLIRRMKSVKTDLEVKGMRSAHWRDSLAIAMLLAQLERDVGQLKLTSKWNEISASKELEFFRRLMDFNCGQSFETISAYGSNGAIVHYRPNADVPPTEYRTIGNDSTYLLDSGGQYLDGTTDITRTVHFGGPTQFQRETYTRVLMGAIDMMSLIFAQSSATPYKLNDLIARRYLFEIGLDYKHGTGHGIGSYSMVHEAPALIEHYLTGANNKLVSSKSNAGGKQQSNGADDQRQQLAYNSDPILLQANMFTSVEPGYYRANEFGIRLENIVVTQRVQSKAPEELEESKPRAAPSSQWLRFEPISLVPFEPKLIKFELLSNKQKAWLNSYNLMVRLRMTQQINYYLTKIKQSQQSRQQTEQLNNQQQIQILGTASSSRLYRQLSQLNATTGSTGKPTQQQQPSPSGRDNFLRLEASRFQQLLEQAHKWIMSKTELIPLDVPQKSLIGARSPNSNSKFTRTSPSDQQQLDDWSALGSDLNGQRLMLGYMSSFPFNDHEAALAAASLAGRAGAESSPSSSDRQAEANKSTGEQQAGVVTQEPQAAPTSANNNGNDKSGANANPSAAAAAASSKQTNKCSGIECDLWLLEVLNSQVSQHLNEQNNHNHKARRRNSIEKQATGSTTYGWPSAVGGGSSSAAATQSSENNDDNQLNESSPYSSDSNNNNNGGGQQQFLSQLFEMFSLSEPVNQSEQQQQSKLFRLLAAWPLLAFGALVVLQLAIMAYVCQSRSAASVGPRGASSSGSNNSKSSRSRSSSSSAAAHSMTSSLRDRPQHQRVSGGRQTGRCSEPIIASANFGQQTRSNQHDNDVDDNDQPEQILMATSEQLAHIQIGSPAFIAHELVPAMSMQHKASI